MSKRLHLPTICDNLRKIVEYGYLLPLDYNYKLYWLGGGNGKPGKAAFRFAHDNIQQAAYDLVAENERRPIHLTIGRMLLRKYNEDQLNGKVFDVVDLFNKEVDLITDIEEKEILVRLNLMAALKAKNSAAYMLASDYLGNGCALLTNDAWENNYQMTRDLFRERAEVEYLVGNFDNSEKLITYLLKKVRTNIEKAEIYNLYIVQKTMLADFKEAIFAGR